MQGAGLPDWQPRTLTQLAKYKGESCVSKASMTIKCKVWYINFVKVKVIVFVWLFKLYILLNLAATIIRNPITAI